MRTRITRVAIAALAAAALPLAVALAVPAAGAVGGAPRTGVASLSGATAATGLRVPPGFTAACARAVGPHDLRCFAEWRPSARGQGAAVSGTDPAAAPARRILGLYPAAIRSAYGITALRGTGTVAVIDGADDPHAEADLAVYRRHFGLAACTTANGCFRKVDVQGAAKPLPAADPGWGVEISLDLQAVSAACPACHLLLVETPMTIAGLSRGNSTAVRLGAVAVSNSWGATEYAGMSALNADYAHPGVPILASTGDNGLQPAQFPAILTNVIGVGGTSLIRAKTGARGWREQAWFGAGSGCSAYVAKPAWQHDTHCPGRTQGDISAVADPDTGLAIYDSFGLGPQSGWLEVGGTSLSSPLVAAMWVASGHEHGVLSAAQFYRPGAVVHDVIGGSTGFCGNDYLCTAVRGYDSPTGVGTPVGPQTFAR